MWIRVRDSELKLATAMPPAVKAAGEQQARTAPTLRRECGGKHHDQAKACELMACGNMIDHMTCSHADNSAGTGV